MAVGTSLLYLYSASRRRKSGNSWALLVLAAITTVIMVPFTWLVMVPTNNELFRLEGLSRVEPEIMDISGAKDLVIKWAYMHITRSVFPLLGAIMGVLGTF